MYAEKIVEAVLLYIFIIAYFRLSVDGTHRVTPKQFSQVFIMMAKVSEKWIPGVYGLLPTHNQESYRLVLFK